MQLPAVIALVNYVPTISSKPPAFTRRNVFLRDSFACQYCLQKFSSAKLTYDHVIPVSKQGANDWTNVVTACSACNGKKGDRTLQQMTDMKLHSQPYRPSARMVVSYLHSSRSA